MIVVDTNLLAYLLLPTPFTAQAEAVLDKDSGWLAPGLIHSELRNVFLGAVRRGDIGLADAQFLLERSLELVTVPDKDIDGSAVFTIAMESGCSAYDCEFVWLARDLGLPLVTVDKKVLNAFPNLAVLSETFLQAAD
jgi:predicted nucleic acid-binding protein